jgi:hypothetical protein
MRVFGSAGNSVSHHYAWDWLLVVQISSLSVGLGSDFQILPNSKSSFRR